MCVFSHRKVGEPSEQETHRDSPIVPKLGDNPQLLLCGNPRPPSHTELYRVLWSPPGQGPQFSMRTNQLRLCVAVSSPFLSYFLGCLLRGVYNLVWVVNSTSLSRGQWWGERCSGAGVSRPGEEGRRQGGEGGRTVSKRLEKGKGLHGLPESHPDAELEVETGVGGELTPIWGLRPRGGV